MHGIVIVRFDENNIHIHITFIVWIYNVDK